MVRNSCGLRIGKIRSKGYAIWLRLLLSSASRRLNMTFLKGAALVKKYFKSENEKVKLAVNEPTRARDQMIVTKHSKLQSCVASITTTISTLIERKNESELSLIEALSDSARLIIDAIFEETSICRSLIASNVNSTLKDALASTEIDGYLFGKDLSERLKQTKLTSLDVQALAKKSSSRAPKNSRCPLQQSRPRNTSVAAPSGHKQSTTLLSRQQ
ncbi:hypothetical protein TKK_0001199 [Trichogramma kaykai]